MSIDNASPEGARPDIQVNQQLSLYQVQVESRISSLEQYKIKVEQRLSTLKGIAIVVGVVGFASGAWLTSIWNTIQGLDVRTEILEGSLDSWEKQVETATGTLNETVQSELGRSIGLIEHAADQKRLELSQLSTADLLEVLKDGSAEINVKALKISNSMGISVIDLKADEGGDGLFQIKSEDGGMRFKFELYDDNPAFDVFNASKRNILSFGAYSKDGEGFFRLYDHESEKSSLTLDAVKGGRIIVNSQLGSPRYLLEVQNDRPIVNYRNSKGELAISMGVFTDGEEPFLRFFDTDSSKKVIELRRSEKGGAARFYGSDDDLLIFVGPDNSGGDGLINVFDAHGEKQKSYSHASN